MIGDSKEADIIGALNFPPLKPVLPETAEGVLWPLVIVSDGPRPPPKEPPSAPPRALPRLCSPSLV